MRLHVLGTSRGKASYWLFAKKRPDGKAANLKLVVTYWALPKFFFYSWTNPAMSSRPCPCGRIKQESASPHSALKISPSLFSFVNIFLPEMGVIKIMACWNIGLLMSSTQSMPPNRQNFPSSPIEFGEKLCPLQMKITQPNSLHFVIYLIKKK